MAPCSHVWHYKCIRPILIGPTWPNFLCPNCRAVADLEEDVEDPGDYEDWEDEEEEAANGEPTAKLDNGEGDRHITPRASIAPVNGNEDDEGGVSLAGLQQGISQMNVAELPDNVAREAVLQTPDRRAEPPTSSVTQPVTINVLGANDFSGLSPLYPDNNDGLSPDRVHDGPMTPRNDAGPFVLDGSAGRAAGNRLRDESPGSDTGSAHSAPSLPPVRFD